MIPATPSEHRGRAAAEPFVSSDLLFELARLQASPEYAREGHAGRTLTKYTELRVVLETMKAGTRMTLHETEEELTLQVFLGQLRLWMRHGENTELAEGSFAAASAGRVHEVEALQDSSFLLTLAWPPIGARAAGRGDTEENGAGI
jgi:quercetin dioxygenase-like cupin family protein